MVSQRTGDSNYEAEKLLADPHLKIMREQGWELGFHPGMRTYADAQAYEEENSHMARIQTERARGGRQHGLRFQVPHTWRFWEDAGFLYDSTFGFAEHEGFRAGLCAPFRPFDLLENRRMNLWELPLTVMDCTLDRYRGLDAAAAKTAVQALWSTVKARHGVFVLLWHNNYFGRNNVGDYHDVFADLVETAIQDGATVAPAIDAIKMWERHARLIQAN
jgi:hypothetical protein